MKDDNKKFLDECRWIHDALMRGDSVSGFNLAAMADVMRQEWEPDLYLDMSSYNDVMSFIKRLYTRYDQFLQKKKQSINTVSIDQPTNKENADA